MTYAEYIAQLRPQVGDNPKRTGASWLADGTITAFQMPKGTFPVYDDASRYVVKDNGTEQTENTDYSLDKESGTLVFATAPSAGHTITIDCSVVHLTNASWISHINAGIRSLGKDFFKEFTDDTTFTSTANMLSLSLATGQPNCIAVYGFQWRGSSSEDWEDVSNFVNWRYDPDNNIIHIGLRTAFYATGNALRIRGLKTYTIGDSVSDDLDVQDQYLTVVEYLVKARYWKHRYQDVVETVTKQTQDATRTPLQNLIMLADRAERDYEAEKAKLKPMKPAQFIPKYLEGGGRP